MPTACGRTTSARSACAPTGSSLGVDGTPLIELIDDPDAPPAPPGSTGLFHLASWSRTARRSRAPCERVVESGERFTGASDHFVSEALYLRDPEGNGIEIYRDRPRSEWEYEPNGELQMGTVALDIDSVMAELPDGDDAGMPDGTRIGHVHLHVADLGVVGVVLRRRPGARRDGPQLPGRALPLARRLPPSHRAQHLAGRGRAAAAGGLARARGLRAAAAGRRGGLRACVDPLAATTCGVLRGADSRPRGLRQRFVHPLAVAAPERQALVATTEDRLVLVGAGRSSTSTSVSSGGSAPPRCSA